MVSREREMGVVKSALDRRGLKETDHAIEESFVVWQKEIEGKLVSAAPAKKGARKQPSEKEQATPMGPLGGKGKPRFRKSSTQGQH